MGLMRQSLLKRLATDGNGRPQTACKPFDARRSGTVIAEGGGLLILEDLESARGRKARAYAQVSGFGGSSNPGSWTDPKAHARAVQLAMQRAMADAGVRPDEVDLVVAFAPGTVPHDLGEAMGIAAALGGNAGRVPVVAIKGATGLCGAGAGTIDTAVAAMAIHTGRVPPTINFSQPDPQCPILVNREVLQREVKVAVTIGYALGGGQYGALVLRKHEG
jgi:3-oxoacyl-[acyl-carrier-protein] synthase II